MDDQQFCLRWNDFQTNMVASFKHLRDEKSFCDVTLACDGQSTKAHKMILSACSSFGSTFCQSRSVIRDRSTYQVSGAIRTSASGADAVGLSEERA